MGMIANLLPVTPKELEIFRVDSGALEAVIYNDEDTISRVRDIDKSWEGILFLLTGAGASAITEPVTNLARVLFSGQLVNPDQDLGYGPAHYNDPEQVAQIARELEAIPVEELSARFDPAEMTRQQIYPTIWDRLDEDLVGYLMDYFDEIRLQYRNAAENGQAMITFLS